MFPNFFNTQTYLQGDTKPQHLTITNHLGRGNSQVYLGELVQPPEPIAIAIAIKQSQIKTDYEYQNFLKEISTLRKLSVCSEGIIGYQGYFITVERERERNGNGSRGYGGGRRYGYLLMERGEMNLAEFVGGRIKQGCRPTVGEIRVVVGTLIDGFAYLQSVNIAHCDIKPENILVTNLNPFQVKICDVGSSKVVNQQQQSESTINGTLSFLAPQLIKIQQIKITSINPFISDVFSFGLVILYMVTGKKFNSQERKQVNEQIYGQVINQWVRYAGEILQEEGEVVQALRKALEFDLYKRLSFMEIKSSFQSSVKKRRIIDQNRNKRLKRSQTQSQSVETRKQTNNSQKTKLPQVKNSNSSTLISFHSKHRLTQKISTGNLKNTIKSSNQTKQTKKSHQKHIKQSQKSKSKSKSRISPMQKTTMYSTFSIDKSKVSINSENKKTIYITQQNYNFIPYQNIFQEEKIFVLFYPSIQFEEASSVVIKRQCSMEVFDKLSHVKSANNLYLQYNQTQFYGPDQNTPSIQNFQSVYINLQNSIIEGGYNNLLRILCPISLKNLYLQLSGSQITFPQVRQQLQRIKTKQIQKLDLRWDNSYLTPQNLTQLTQKLSKLPLKKLTLSLASTYLKPPHNSRWPLPATCKTLYLNLPNNCLNEIIGNLSSSISQLSELKQFFINVENNCLNDVDVKVLVKGVGNVSTLEKAVMNFSMNRIEKGRYCFEGVGGFGRVSSLEVRIARCGIEFQQFLEILEEFMALFYSNLTILKLTYDRKISKNILYTSIQKIIKQQTNINLKLDIIGYDYSYYMIYIKKKLSQKQPLKIKTKQHTLKSSKTSLLNQPSSTKNTHLETSSNRTIPYVSVSVNPTINSTSALKHKLSEDDFSTIPNLKSGVSNKCGTEKVCEMQYSNYGSYECYICLGCIEGRESSKFEYFCRSCIENCEHKGHNIVRTYQRKNCNCLYNYKCHYNLDEVICSQKLGIKYKKQYQCRKCFPGRPLCYGCIIQCQQAHPQYIQARSSGFFQCQGLLQEEHKNIKNTSKQQKVF